MKLFFIDLETTGTDAKQHGVIQFSGIIEIDGEEKERLNLLIRPFPDDAIEESALEVNRRTKEEILSFPEPLEVYRNLKTAMSKYIDQYNRSDKFHFVGYNSRFDDDFLRAWFRKCGDKYYGSFFFWPSIDAANMAAVYFLEHRGSFSNFQLMTVAEAMGIEIDKSKAHDAMYDIEITKQLFYLLREKV